MQLTHKKTKILCTIGPSSMTTGVLKKMHDSGMNAVRINTAHGDFTMYRKLIQNVRKIADIPIVIDIKGPELRIRCKESKLVAKHGLIKIGFKPDDEISLSHNVYDNLVVGSKVLIKDGRFAFTIVEKKNGKVTLRAEDNSIIEPNKNVNVPDRSLDIPGLSKKDLDSILFAIKEKVDYIALSFCRNAKDVENVRNKLGNSGIRIISKIENREGIDNISEIIASADGIMVARGDLGVELPEQEVPLLQKKMVRECNEKGKLVIVATQMLESMINSPIPTRAEVSDIANAILDGADCLMLSGETAQGKYPVESVSWMAKVSIEVESQVKTNLGDSSVEGVSAVIAESAFEISKKLNVSKIVCLTYSGHTAAMISRYRPMMPVLAITKSEMVKRQMMLYFSVHPIHYNMDLWKMPLTKTIEFLWKRGLLSKDETILFTGGLHTLEGKKTNTIQVHKIRDILSFMRKYKD